MKCERCRGSNVISVVSKNRKLEIVPCPCTSSLQGPVNEKIKRLKASNDINDVQIIHDELRVLRSKASLSFTKETTEPFLERIAVLESKLEVAWRIAEAQEELESIEKELGLKLDCRQKFLDSLSALGLTDSGDLPQMTTQMNEAVDAIVQNPSLNKYILIYGQTSAEANEAVSRILWEIAERTGELTEHISEDLLLEALVFETNNARTSRKGVPPTLMARLKDICQSPDDVGQLVMRSRRCSHFAILSALADPSLPEHKTKFYQEFLERRQRGSGGVALTFLAVGKGKALERLVAAEHWAEITSLLNSKGRSVDAVGYNALAQDHGILGGKNIPLSKSAKFIHTQSRTSTLTDASSQMHCYSEKTSLAIPRTPQSLALEAAANSGVSFSTATSVIKEVLSDIESTLQPNHKSILDVKFQEQRDERQERNSEVIELCPSRVGNIALVHSEHNTVIERNQIPFVRTILRHSGIIFPCLSSNERSTLTKIQHLFFERRGGSKVLIARFEESRGFADSGHKKIGRQLRSFKGGLGGASIVSEENFIRFQEEHPHPEYIYEPIRHDETHDSISIESFIYGNKLQTDGKTKQINEFSIRGAYCDADDLKLLGTIWASIYAQHEANPHETLLEVKMKQADLLRLMGKHNKSSKSSEWLRRALWRLSNKFISYKEEGMERETPEGRKNYNRHFVDIPFIEFEKIEKNNILQHYLINVPDSWRVFFAKEAPALAFVDRHLFAGLPNYACHLFSFMSTHSRRAAAPHVLAKAADGFFSTIDLEKGSVWIELTIQEWQIRLGAGSLEITDASGTRQVIRQRPLGETRFRVEFIAALNALNKLGLLDYGTYKGTFLDRAKKRMPTDVYLVKLKADKLHTERLHTDMRLSEVPLSKSQVSKSRRKTQTKKPCLEV